MIQQLAMQFGEEQVTCNSKILGFSPLAWRNLFFPLIKRSQNQRHKVNPLWLSEWYLQSCCWHYNLTLPVYTVSAMQNQYSHYLNQNHQFGLISYVQLLVILSLFRCLCSCLITPSFCLWAVAALTVTHPYLQLWEGKYLLPPLHSKSKLFQKSVTLTPLQSVAAEFPGPKFYTNCSADFQNHYRLLGVISMF